MRWRSRLAANVVRMSICVARNEAKLQETSGLRSWQAGGQAEIRPCDVSQREAVDALIDSRRRKVWQAEYLGE
jgi:short-subunit dehydrogenase